MWVRMFKPQTADRLRQEMHRGLLCRAVLGCGLCERDGWQNPRERLAENHAPPKCARIAAHPAPHQHLSTAPFQEKKVSKEEGLRVEDGVPVGMDGFE